MKAKKKAKNRRELNKIVWKKHKKEDQTKLETERLNDGASEYDDINETIRRYEAGEIDELPEMTITFTPKKRDKQEIINWLKEAKHEDLEKMISINNSINNQFFQGEAFVRELLEYSANHGNLYSMLQLAHCYENEENPIESEPEYLYWLNKIAADPLTIKLIESKGSDEKLGELSIESYEYLKFIAGSAFFELGLYYRNSDQIVELKEALAHFKKAELCGYPFDPDPNVTHEIIVELTEWIRQTERYEKNRQIENNSISLFKDVSIEGLSVDEQISELKKRLICEVGQDIWDGFRKETGKCLVTAVSCFYYLMHSSDNKADMDFSCVIVSLLKTLEHEIRIRFYNEYIKYLQNRFQTVEEFFLENGIAANDRYLDRGGIVSYKDGSYSFTEYDMHQESYTLGSFIYSTGLLSLKRGYRCKGKNADATMIDYCRKRLRQESCKDDEIDKWLCKLARDVNQARLTRNNSAHGGNVNNDLSAAKALDDLLLIKKVLIDLVRDFPVDSL